MSASLLNAAAMPGAAPAGVGIAAQAAQAGLAKGPLAGFEALLAAFFGDQGLTAPATAGQAANQTAVVQPDGTNLPAGGPTAKTVGKGAAAAKNTAKDAADGASSTASAASNASANALGDASVGAALNLAIPHLPAIQAPAIAPSATAGDVAASEPAADATLTGKPAGAAATVAAQVQLATATDAGIAKISGLVAKDTTPDTGSNTNTNTSPGAGPGAGPDADEAATQTRIAAEPAVPSGAPPAPGVDAPAAPQTPPAATLQGPTPADPSPAATAEAVASPVPQTAQGKPAEAASGGKDKGPVVKAARVDGARGESLAIVASGKMPGAAAISDSAAPEGAAKDAAAEERDPNAPAGPGAKPVAGDAAQAQTDFSLAANSTQTPNAASLAHAAALVRGSPQTVANLAAQIARKLDGRTSRFDVQLEPGGLGKVDVRIEIDAAGKMTAAMNFDTQQAANELKSRAGELQRALEQAGFDMSGGLSFDVSGQGGQGGRAHGQDADDAPAFRGRAFQAVLEGSPDAAAIQSSYSRTSRSGVDIRI